MIFLSNEPCRSGRKTGCGIAAVATIVEKTYSEAKANSLGIFAADEKLFSETDYVYQLLKEYKVTLSDTKPFESWQLLPDLALLASKYHEEIDRPFWHWVVFYRKNEQAVLLDSNPPLVENKRTDFDQIRAIWYIKVYK